MRYESHHGDGQLTVLSHTVMQDVAHWNQPPHHRVNDSHLLSDQPILTPDIFAHLSLKHCLHKSLVISSIALIHISINKIRHQIQWPTVFASLHILTNSMSKTLTSYISRNIKYKCSIFCSIFGTGTPNTMMHMITN